GAPGDGAVGRRDHRTRVAGRVDHPPPRRRAKGPRATGVVTTPRTTAVRTRRPPTLSRKRRRHGVAPPLKLGVRRSPTTRRRRTPNESDFLGVSPDSFAKSS